MLYVNLQLVITSTSLCIQVVKVLHGATHVYRAVAVGGNKAEYARGAGQIKEVFQGNYKLTSGGEYEKNYDKKEKTYDKK